MSHHRNLTSSLCLHAKDEITVPLQISTLIMTDNYEGREEGRKVDLSAWVHDAVLHVQNDKVIQALLMLLL